MNGRVMDTFITFYDEVQPGLPELHTSYEDWRGIHHCYHGALGKWGFWWTHKENVGVEQHCDVCGEDFMLVDAGIYSHEQVDFRVPPEMVKLL